MGVSVLTNTTPMEFGYGLPFGFFHYIGVLIRKYDRLLSTHDLVYFLALLCFIVLCNFNGVLNVSVREYGHSFLLYLATGMLGTFFLLWLKKIINNFWNKGTNKSLKISDPVLILAYLCCLLLYL